MASHNAPAVALGKLDSLNGLGHGTDLVHLQQESIGGTEAQVHRYRSMSFFIQ